MTAARQRVVPTSSRQLPSPGTPVDVADSRRGDSHTNESFSPCRRGGCAALWAVQSEVDVRGPRATETSNVDLSLNQRRHLAP